MDVPAGRLFVGDRIDPASGERRNEPVLLDSADLTTHGVIVGMTGSGKTGLAVALLEETLLQGIPCLMLDPKGDLANLLLTFPDLAPADFRPWIDEAQAAREGRTPEQQAEETARTWREGLASWGIDGERIRRLRDTVPCTVYTPGSTAGTPVNVIGDLAAPVGADAETLADEIEGLVSGLLALVGIDADPLAGREHILLSNLVHAAWSEGRGLDLATLVAQVQDPPMRKLGVLEVDAFFPPKDRTALALRLNGLLASPAFAAWLQGIPLDIDRLLMPDGRAGAAIVSLAHLGDAERQFVTTLVLGKLVTWMRRQPGTSNLRALVYMDEVFGFVPPTAAPPSKKPILTILKQARAFGVGMVLATQNPVDVDYKAISNAGTWMIGRLQTERDKARLLDGMQSAGGGVDLATIDATISGLGKRQFVLHTAKKGTEGVFTSRWCMSYLAGPLTREQLTRLRPSTPPAASTAGPEPEPAAAPAAPAPELAADETVVAPAAATGVAVRWLDPAASWGPTVGAVPGGTRCEAAITARVRLLFDDDKADLRHETEWEAVLFPLSSTPDPTAVVTVDLDDRDVRTTPPAGATYVLPEAAIGTKTLFTRFERDLKDHLYRTLQLELLRNEPLGLTARVGETPEEFLARCEAAGDDRADAEAAKVRATLEQRIDRVRAAMAKAEDRVREAQSAQQGKRFDEIVSGATDLLGGLLGGRRSTRSILASGRRVASNRSRSAGAAERVETARNRVAEKVDELEGLEQELRESLTEIQEAWEAKARQVTTLAVGLEKTDIRVSDLHLVWIPTA